jgi:long-chain acyl-CoA synthetase
MSTLLHRLAAWAESTPNAVAQNYKKDGKWKPISAREYCERVYWLALFLESKGMNVQDVATILSYNCPQWVYMELAAVLLGAKSAGLYPNSTPKDIQYVLNHTESRFLAVQNKDYFQRIGESGLPTHVKLILVFDGDTSISPLAVSFEEALAQGQRLAQTASVKTLKDYLNKLDPRAGAFIIYTSGTTGTPKGVVLSSDNLTSTIDVGAKEWNLSPGEGTLFSFLPLCHIAEKLQNLGAGISLRYTVNFCSKFENVSAELPEVQPRLLLCVPRVWEKMMEGVLAKLNSSPPQRRALAQWALKVGAKMAEYRFAKVVPHWSDRVQWEVADRLVLQKIRKALGLESAEALISGAAALPVHVARWFRSLGLEILEVYGQSESSGIITITLRGVDCIGTVGRSPRGFELKLAEDGEILSQGRNVFLHYFKDPESTSKTLVDGWLHTGDLGEKDSRGLIRIIGRKKEIMKTSGGKMVAPVPIEDAIKASPLISQVCMVGDGRKYLAALITLSESKMAEIKDKLPEGSGPLITLPEVLKEVKACIEAVNLNLATYEQVKRFAVLAREFSIAEGEMTPTLKMKRTEIEKKYQQVIEDLYG